jgi:tetratricopeptide (TPR) repeat protein
MQPICKFLLLLSFMLSSQTVIHAQTAKEFFKKGIELYDAGKFEEALVQYEFALKILPNNSGIFYEMATTYVALEKFDKAIKYAEKVIKNKNGNEALAYAVLGTAYDMDGKPKKAIKAYEKGVKAFPNEYNLYYNLGITQFAQKDYDGAEKSAMSSITNNPKHANSHNLLGNIELEKNKKIKSLLPCYGYLMLKPTGKLSVAIRKSIESIYLKGVRVKQDGGNNTIFIDVAMLGSKEEFGSEESTLSMLASMQALVIDKTLKDSLKIVETPENRFFSNTQTLFRLLSEEKRKPFDSFWQTAYVNPIKELYDAKHVEAFCYSIYGDTEGVKKWQEENVDKVVSYDNWLKEQKNKE